MSKRASSAGLHLCQSRAPIPGGSQQDRQREFERSLRAEGPFLIKSELARIRPVRPAPNNLLSRLRQAVDILLGRRRVYVERRNPRP